MFKIQIAERLLNEKDIETLYSRMIARKYPETIISRRFRNEIVPWQYSQQQAFHKAIDSLKWKIERDGEDKQKIIEAFKKMIVRDIDWTYKSEVIYQGHTVDKTAPFIPTLVYENDETINLRGELVEVDIKKIPTLTVPWNSNRLLDAIKRESDFKFQPDNHRGAYFEKLGVAVMDSGNHSITDGILNRNEAVVMLKKVDEDKLFKLMTTNGAYWIAEDTGRKIGEVSDFRFAVLFWLQEQLENN